MPTSLDELLANNQRWARDTERRAPGFFSNLQAQQAPKYLWIDGWVYGLHNGRLEDLAMSVGRGDDPFEVHRRAIATVQARYSH